MSQTFISYASEDAIYAQLVMAKLKEAGLQVWLDQGDLRGGDEWRDAIDQGISDSDAMLVLVSPDSVKSPYVTYEWGYALGHGRKVIPLLLKQAEVHPRLEVLQYLDFQNASALPWVDLISLLREAKTNRKSNQKSNKVGDMTTAQLKNMIAAAVALSNAEAKTTGGDAGGEYLSHAADSVVDAVQSSAAQSAHAENRKILWVDDRPDNNVYERETFQSLGFDFTLALSTADALKAIELEPFDMIISDMGRNEGPKEGYVLLDALRGNGNTTPFVIYAGSNAPEHKKLASDRGAQGSTNNPSELLELVIENASSTGR